MRLSFALRNFRLATTALSYTGASRLGYEYGPIRVLGAHGFISNNGLGPEFTAHVGLFEGELWWDILYMDGDMSVQEAQVVADRIREILSDSSRL